MKGKNGEEFFEEYVQINEIKQYFLHYRKDSDFVVLFLHGGMTEAHFGYKNVLKISHGNGTFDIQYCEIYIKDMQDGTL